MPEIKLDIRAKTLVVAANDSLNKNMADYVCDGTADDAEIQAALTAAAGGSVFLLEGTYNITANLTVPDDTSLMGSGFGTIISGDGAGIGGAENGLVEMGNRTMLRSLKAVIAAGAGVAGARPNCVFADSKTQIWIENCWLYGDQTVGDADDLRQNGIRFNSVTYSKVINNRIENIERNGVIFENVTYSDIHNNTIYDCEQSGIALGVTGSVSEHVAVKGNIIRDSVYCGVYLDTTNKVNISDNIMFDYDYGIYVYGCYDTVIADNIFDGDTATSSGGIYLDEGYNSVVEGNHLQDDGGAAISVGGSDYSSISGNHIKNPSGHGISMFSGSDHCSVSGNTIDTTGDDGIYNLGCEYCSITGNAIRNHTDYGIDIYQADYCAVTGNTCYGGKKGILLYAADYNTVTGNACISGSEDGINTQNSGNYNTISSNTCTNNTDDGIEVVNGTKNIVIGNQLLGNGTAFVDGGTNTEVGHNITV